MAGGGNRGGGGRGARGGRSLGAAAGGGHPSGAILDDSDELLQQKQRFKAWSEGYRSKKKLKPNAKLEMLYNKSPSPPKGG